MHVYDGKKSTIHNPYITYLQGQQGQQGQQSSKFVTVPIQNQDDYQLLEKLRVQRRKNMHSNCCNSTYECTKRNPCITWCVLIWICIGIMLAITIVGIKKDNNIKIESIPCTIISLDKSESWSCRVSNDDTQTTKCYELYMSVSYIDSTGENKTNSKVCKTFTCSHDNDLSDVMAFYGTYHVGEKITCWKDVNNGKMKYDKSSSNFPHSYTIALIIMGVILMIICCTPLAMVCSD